MKTTGKTIRLSEETYEELVAYRAELEKINRAPISFDEAVDMLLGETAGAQYEIQCEVARFKTAQDNCTCGAAEKVAPPAEYQQRRMG